MEEGYRPGSSPDFERLYQATYPRLLGTLVLMLGDRAAAEDCLQEAYLKAQEADPQAEGALSGDFIKALRKLPPKQLAAIVLRHYHGYTNREIAQALGIPERTVASRLAAARERLRRELGAEFALPSGTGDGNGVNAHEEVLDV
jgi:DNA-directed RNA polymerase specialized sigma24 family protein